MDKLKVYFVHSVKSDYNNLIYLPVLRSNFLSHHELIFPHSNENKDKYFMDLMTKADLIVVELTNPDITLNLELKQAVLSKKPILALAQNSVGYDARYQKLLKNVIGYNNGDDVRQYVETFVKSYVGKISGGQVDPTLVLGNLTN